MKLIWNGHGGRPEELKVKVEPGVAFEIEDEALARKLLMSPHIVEVKQFVVEPRKARPSKKAQEEE